MSIPVLTVVVSRVYMSCMCSSNKPKVDENPCSSCKIKIDDNHNAQRRLCALSHYVLKHPDEIGDVCVGLTSSPFVCFQIRSCSTESPAFSCDLIPWCLRMVLAFLMPQIQRCYVGEGATRERGEAHRVHGTPERHPPSGWSIQTDTPACYDWSIVPQVFGLNTF